MVNCPVCTYENYGGTHCEMCNSPLNWKIKNNNFDKFN